MSHSGKTTPYEERQKQYKEERERREKKVIVKHLHYLHNTERAVLVKEGEPLAGDRWRVEGRELWLPLSQVIVDPPVNKLERFDPVELLMAKWLAEEKELPYE